MNDSESKTMVFLFLGEDFLSIAEDRRGFSTHFYGDFSVMFNIAAVGIVVHSEVRESAKIRHRFSALHQ